MTHGGVVLLVGLCLAASACGGSGNGAPDGCSKLDAALSKDFAGMAGADFVGASTADELYADTEQFIRDMKSDQEKCLTAKDRAAAFASARSSIGADCQACRDELDRAEG